MSTNFNIIVDTGCFILIWLVQLIIYPSFEVVKENQFQDWHKKYTISITAVVMPLMLLQVSTVIWDWYTGLSTIAVIRGVLIALTWIFTFFVFVPLHHLLSTDVNKTETMRKLVSRNWIRTVLWTCIFLLSAYQVAT